MATGLLRYGNGVASESTRVACFPNFCYQYTCNKNRIVWM